MPIALEALTIAALILWLLRRQKRSVVRLFQGSRHRARQIIQGAMAEVKSGLYGLNFDTWGSAERTVVEAQLTRTMRSLSSQLTKQQLAEIPGIVSSAAGDTSVFLTQMDKRVTGSVQPLRFDTLAWWERQNREISEARRRVFERAFVDYGASTVLAVEQAVAQNVLLGEPWEKAREKVWDATRRTVGDQGYMVDRILRTEQSAAYNGATLAALIEEDDPNDPMSKRLITTFDAVTGRDSIYVHGQTRLLDEPFVDNKGRVYQAPPNRPNDREIVVGWRESYGDPEFDEGIPEVSERGGLRGRRMRIPRSPRPTPVELQEAFARAGRAERALVRDRLRTQAQLLARHRSQLALASGPDRRSVQTQIAQDEFAIRQLESQVGILASA